MATRIVHLTDLHFSPRNSVQPDKLAASVSDLQPDIVVVTGDLTHSGQIGEFQQAAAFIESLPGRKLVVPGNHDVPVFSPFERLWSPFKRFDRFFLDKRAPIETADVILLGLNTAVGSRLGWDWSLGKAAEAEVRRLSVTLHRNKSDRLGIVACHHPLRLNPVDPRRSRTGGGDHAFHALSTAGMDLLLHGHLHRATSSCALGERGRVSEVCTNPALSDRERGGHSGYNVIDVSKGAWTLASFVWHEGQYTAATHAHAQPLA